MKFLSLYRKVLSWASHIHAVRYLAVVSFIEASCFPIPPDVMLIPMILAKPQRAFHYARIVILFSTIGGMFGYFLGHYAFEPLVLPSLQAFGYLDVYYQVLELFRKWGFWILCCIGCVPIPYKLFSVSAGFLNYNVFLFMIASLIGRSGRFFLVAFIMKKGNEKIKDKCSHFFGVDKCFPENQH